MQADASILFRQRVDTPQGDYVATLQQIAVLVSGMEKKAGVGELPVGICTPGSRSPVTGLMRNANSTCLNDQPLLEDLHKALGRQVRMANDADCLALSEALDGAARNAASVFAVILGTGVGGGWVVNQTLTPAANGIAGEWGHTPLPWMDSDEYPGATCWCGLQGCIETFLSGPGLTADFLAHSGQSGSAADIAANAATNGAAEQALQRYEHRLARALAMIINILDPQVIVLGGGLSNMQRLYAQVPKLWHQWVFSDVVNTRLVAAEHGDSSGVRGAARLWQ